MDILARDPHPALRAAAGAGPNGSPFRPVKLVVEAGPGANPGQAIKYYAGGIPLQAGVDLVAADGALFLMRPRPAQARLARE